MNLDWREQRLGTSAKSDRNVKKQASLVVMMLAVLLMGCSASVPSTSSQSGEPAQPLQQASPVSSPTSAPTTPAQQAHSSPEASPAQNKRGQTLPISAKATMAGQVIQLEVARTPQQQQMGLMYRTSLADDRGMLFLFNPPQPINFWMKNTLIPLDMVFMLDGVVKEIVADVPPCKTSLCPTYGPNTPVNQVIELRGGRAAELGLKAGDRVTIQ
ncbi:DUF192 domain-containing protein [Trichocoleus sp. DQ-A3]|uniref:DUF192 domain-containing protein n=1 Tax=Cyanophyceae TaxID=3028117 RepID=UPI001F5516FA|nr:DUF192 domain-containing protein [Coleofasciculus sp. FACHB-125]